MMNNVIKTGGGKFDPREENVYFIASNTERLAHGVDMNHHLLVAVNELGGQESLDFFVKTTQVNKKKVFLDSGVYNLAMSYARNHNVSMDVALSLAPTEMEGFSDLFDSYVSIVKTHGDHLWGYIEIDQGGRENKIKTRARLESLDLRPIPVYHPFNDGWDYFDYLAERYDRICFGNIVKANAPTRQRLIATAWERHRKYPHLWIHCLGLTPNQWLNALPINSGDSSTWLSPIRWPNFAVRCDGMSMSELGQGYRYVQQSDPSSSVGSIKATQLCAYKSRMDMLTWRTHLADLRDLDFEIYPEPRGEMRRATQ